MFARYEKRISHSEEKIWVAKWLNLKNAMHWHDEPELIYCESGKCLVETESETFALKNGECALLESGTIHNIHSENGTICITLRFDVDLIAPIMNSKRLKQEKLTYPPDIPAFYKKIKNELDEKREFFSVIVNATSISLIADIFRKEETEPSTFRHGNPRYSFLKSLLDEIETNYRFLRFEDMCKKFGYSPSHFSRLFTGLTGMTFTKYLTAVKIGHAVELLQTKEKKSVTEIALECGFSSIRNFNRYFKEFTGYTPKSLPVTYIFSQNTFRLFREPFDPTEKNSILL